jgi:short subunit dehydrogenase-like uncharacterized protein
MTTHYDIALMGATSFVGKITAKRFAAILESNPNSLKLLLVARSEQKMNALMQELKERYPNVVLDTLIVDSMNQQEMSDLAEKARVVISTVGPYDLMGEPLVRACAEQGTHYCDLTGEPQFIHRMLSKYEPTAKASGACIVHCCGFDSIPSDLGVLFLQQQSQEQYQSQCIEIDMRVKALSGGFSGGTIASLINIVKQIRKDSTIKTVLMNPYALCDENANVKQRFINKAQLDPVSGGWVAPFMMASINSKIVMRSAQLNQMDMTKFKYNEGMLTGRGNKGKRRAKLTSLMMNLLMLGVAMTPTRWLMEKTLLPKPGQGPSEREQENGFFVIRLYGKTEQDQSLVIEVTGDEDPGYGSTSKMLSQAALCLAFDLPKDQTGGFWTPASLLGQGLIERLIAHAGFTFKIQEKSMRS